MTQDKFKLWTRVSLMAVLAFIIAPIIFMVIKGLAGLATAIVIAMIANALFPAFSEYLTQLKFKSMRFIVDRAPVETLINLAKERWDQLAEMKELLRQQAATLESYKKKAIQFAKEYPEDAAETQHNLAQYEQLFAYRVEAFKEAKAATHEFMRTVDKAEAIYDMAVADAQVDKAFGKGKDFMTIFKQKTAFEAIDKASAEALTNVRMALLDNDYADKVEAPARAVVYDAQNKVQLGSILDMGTVPLPHIKDQ